MIETDFYLNRGVSSSKSEVHDAISNLDAGVFPGTFCKILPDTMTGSDDYCLIMHADGAGTKSSLAYLYWKETGDLSVFKGIAMDSLVMNLDDLACVGALDNLVLSNTIGRNKFFIPGEVIKAVIDGYEEALEMLRGYGIDIAFAGGETADVGDLTRTLIVDSTLIGRLAKKDVIDYSKLTDGDVIIGFASDGQAPWEREYNSGMGSNGLTAARHDILGHDYAAKYPETYAPQIPKELVYCGNAKITDPLPGTDITIGKAILSPTKTYAPMLRKVFNKYRDQIHGMVHCSGGGQTKCKGFGNKIHYVKDNLFPLPPFYEYIKNTGKTLRDMYPVHNMGHRLEMYVPEAIADEIISLAAEVGIVGQRIGYCKAADSDKNQLTIKAEPQVFEY